MLGHATRALGLAIVAALADAADPDPARAQSQSQAQPLLPPQPQLSIGYNNLFAIRVNPLGLVDFFDVALRLRLYEHDSDALKQNYVGVGVTGGISPAWGRIGGIIEVQPLTILKLYARYQLIGYFGSFDLLASFPSADAAYSDTAIEARAQDPATPAYATFGGELQVGANVQLKLGPIALREFFQLTWSSLDLRDGDVVFYDQVPDMLMPNDGWMARTETDVLWVSDFGLVAGVRYTYSHSFYDDRHYAGGTTPAVVPNNDIHRIGPLIAYIFDDNPGGRIEAPTILLLAQWHLVHRWRTGADVTTGLPYLALAFTLRGDLLSDH